MYEPAVFGRAAHVCQSRDVRVTIDPGQDEAAFLEAVVERIEVESDTRSEMLESFALSYLYRYPWSDTTSADSLYREVLNLFEFIEKRSGPIAVRAFNPTIDDHGYPSSGTVVEIHVDDSPFLVDSITNELAAHQLDVVRVLHPVLGTTRDGEGRLTGLKSARSSDQRESVQHYLLERQLFKADLPALEKAITRVLQDVRATVRDFQPLLEVLPLMASYARRGKSHYPVDDVNEAVAFLEWLADDNFVLLGYREYRLDDGPDGKTIQCVPDSGLGILSDHRGSSLCEPKPLSTLTPQVAARYERGELLVISKTNRLATVHRRARMDYIGVRIVGDDGSSVGEARLLGLFTSKAYMERASRTPVLRQKLADIARAEDLIEGSHDHKAVVALFESFPKDELFGVPDDDLRRLLIGLLELQEKARVQLFVRRDLLDRSARVLLAIPRDRYSTSLARRLERLFLDRFEGESVDFHLELGSSELARLHFRVWVGEGPVPDVDFEKLDRDVLRITRSWQEQVTEVLGRDYGKQTATHMAEKWAPRFPSYYTSSTELNVAAGDIESLDHMTRNGLETLVGIQNELDGSESLTRVALYGYGKRPLSDLIPALEDMGLQVIEEVPTRITGAEEIFIHDFGVKSSLGRQLDLETSRDRVSAALTAVWGGGAESDTLSRLVVVGGLDHVQVEILRAYRTYWRRVKPTFTVAYVNDTLVEHAEITWSLMELFAMRFDPAGTDDGYEALRYEVLGLLDDVPSLDQDRILRGFLGLIDATLRTNVYKPERRSISFKLASPEVPDMPAPRPHVEVFVMGRDVEGIHLRAGPIARGGIRWSDRREDYRTEVLGLMKAQVTKNSVIVPTGAKGGFVLTSHGAGHESARDRAEAAYDTYIRGLLDLTDNLVDGEVIHPDNVRVRDGDDPYLVVAADKGTATFSDAANAIAADYGYWLGDAFASGGSTGYDHKELGITARGAWKSLERHLFELELNPKRDSFTAIGIGDMSGDVFGNGMLQSHTIRLIAAFDHRHIFIDPEPDPNRAFEERSRLFGQPGSSWADYDASLISHGGGVYPRSAKEVQLTDEVRETLAVDAQSVTPAELIRMILRAPVDVLFNGGIGTYVKGTDEADDAVGDRANAQVRVSGSDLRCRVVVEGGNLGLTQAGRVEYSSGGGKINTDFIDNSGGVNCSDREVNLKILLRLMAGKGLITSIDSRVKLSEAASEVVEKILEDNFEQAQRISLEVETSPGRLDSYEDLMTELERNGVLDREIEGLPSSEEMTERSRRRAGLDRPELAVLMAYAKGAIARSLLASSFAQSPGSTGYLQAYFPSAIFEEFGSVVGEHPLRREIVCTLAANEIVNTQGTSFVSQLEARSGADTAEVALAYTTARDVADARSRRRLIESHMPDVDAGTWLEVMNNHDRTMSTLTRWFLRHTRPDSGEVSEWKARFSELETLAPDLGPPSWKSERASRADELISAGFAPAIARRLASLRDLIHAPGIIDLARRGSRAPSDIARIFFRIGQAVQLDALEGILAGMVTTDSWNRWARQTIEDDLAEMRRLIAERVLAEGGDREADDAVDLFLARRAHALKRVLEFTHTLEDDADRDLTFFMVVARQVETLATPVP